MTTETSSLPSVQLFTDGACKASGRIELTIRNLYDGLPVRRVAPCDGLEVRRTGKFISAARLKETLVRVARAIYFVIPPQRQKRNSAAVKLCRRTIRTLTLIMGHAGHAENERCDVLAVEAADRARYSG